MRNCLLLISAFFIVAMSSTVAAQQKVIVVPMGDDGETAASIESETGNTRNEATNAYKILESDQITGSISTPGDVDYYRLFLPYCHQITAETEAVGSDTCANGGSIDSLVTILNSTESSTLDSNDDISASNSCSKAQGVSVYHSGSYGFYLVKVEASPDCSQCTFNYKLKLSKIPTVC